MPRRPAAVLPEAVEDRGLEDTPRLVGLVYAELHKLAAGYLHRERPDHTLQPTALINEAYLQLIEQKRIRWDRAHFLGTAALLMRRILREHARGRAASKRQHERVLLEDSLAISNQPAIDMLDLERALEELAERDPVLARLVELRFFGGLSIDETANELSLSAPTVKRHWRLAKAYLFRKLSGAAAQ